MLGMEIAGDKMAARLLVHGDFALASIAAAMFLAGCAGQQRPMRRKKDRAAVRGAAKDIASNEDARRQSFGFQPDSPGYTECREGLRLPRLWSHCQLVERPQRLRERS
jgi:hypothetical protein